MKTEKEMQTEKVLRPTTEKELQDYISSLVDREHDYGTCVYAMSMAAVAAFYYVSHKLGVTGFQASCADMDILRRTRSMDCPFMIIKGDDMLYPQYDIVGSVRKCLSEWAEWASEEATKKIDEHGTTENVHPEVMKHWKALSRMSQGSTADD